MNVTHEYLVEEVLYELLFEWAGRKQTVEIGTKELGNEVTA